MKTPSDVHRDDPVASNDEQDAEHLSIQVVTDEHSRRLGGIDRSRKSVAQRRALPDDGDPQGLDPPLFLSVVSFSAGHDSHLLPKGLCVSLRWSSGGTTTRRKEMTRADARRRPLVGPV